MTAYQLRTKTLIILNFPFLKNHDLLPQAVQTKKVVFFSQILFNNFIIFSKCQISQLDAQNILVLSDVLFWKKSRKTEEKKVANSIEFFRKLY